MDSSSDSLCERIINEIDAVFVKTTDLKFEIIPTKLNQNKSPVVHVENNLGLESWCVKYVFNYAHRVVLESSSRPSKGGGGGASWHHHNGDIIKYLNVAILLNPDVALYWNIRRYLFGHNKLNLTKEFQFSVLVLSKKPKSNEAFAYRRWLFLFLSGESIDLSFEVSLCERYADRSSSNYHAWCHRLWVLDQDPNLLRYEFQLTEKFIRRHISDFSCFHHRLIVLQKLRQLQFFEDTPVPSYSDLKALIAELNQLTDLQTPEDILAVIAPKSLATSSSGQVRSFLFCMNLAAYDLRLVDDLTQMFGEREGFSNHRRSIKKFIFDTCLTMNRNDEDMVENNAKTTSPVAKISKLSDQVQTKNGGDTGCESQLFLSNLCRNENPSWCKIFLSSTTTKPQ